MLLLDGARLWRRKNFLARARSAKSSSEQKEKQKEGDARQIHFGARGAAESQKSRQTLELAGGKLAR